MAITLEDALEALKIAHKALADFRDHPFEPMRSEAYAKVDAVLKAANQKPE